MEENTGVFFISFFYIEHKKIQINTCTFITKLNEKNAPVSNAPITRLKLY